MGLFAGRYMLLAPISSGGTGAVWRAWDVRHRRYVAAKLLHARDAGSLLRFVREQALRIGHPHVLAPLGWAADDDQVLLTMELVRGGTVAQLLADHGGLPVPYAAVLVDQLLDALTAAHSHGVVHRDVKPSNLLLAVTGRGTPSLRLADFGIAAVLGEPRLTRTTRVVGTPGYLPPEVLDGAEPDPRQDVYAAGVVAAELLTGRRPEPGTALPEGVPDPIWHFVRAATASDPDDRLPSAAAARTAWQAALAAARVGPIDSADPDAVEVFDQIGELPAGFDSAGPVPDRPTATMPLPGPPRLAPEPNGGTPQRRTTEVPGSTAAGRRRAVTVALAVATLGAALLAV
ncbi:MAG: serine/threonine-protein kinase, partial [Micromonosporaceae bacterium]